MAALDVSACTEGNVVNLSITPANPTGPQIDTLEKSRFTTATVDFAIQALNIQIFEQDVVSNQLNHTISNLTNISLNLSAARVSIEDADCALKTTNLAKNQILQQASIAMLVQANASKQNVLSLSQG